MDARSIAATAANKGYLTAATDVDVEFTNPTYHLDVYKRQVVCFTVLKFEGGSTMNNHEMMALDEKHNAEFEELVKYCMTSGAINIDL